MLIEFGQESFNLKKSDHFLSLMANLTLTEPNYEPLGPAPLTKVGSICGYFLDLSLNSKFKYLFGQKSFNLEKSGEFLSLRANLALIEPKFEPWGVLTNPKSGFNLELLLRF